MALVGGVVLLGALLIGEIANQVVGSGTSASAREHRSYLTAVRPISVDSTMVGALVRTVRNGTAVDRGRLALEFTLQRALTGARDDAASLSSIGLGAPSPRLDAALTSAITLRLAAVRALVAGVQAAIGAPQRPRDVQGATALLTSAGAHALQADAAYARWLKGVRALHSASHEPISRWIALPLLWRAPATALWARTLAGDPALHPVQALRIVSLSLQPAAVRILGLPTTTTTSSLAATTTTSSTVSTTTTAGATTTTQPNTAATSSTTTTTIAPTSTTLQLPPAGSVSVLPPTGSLAVLAVVAEGGNAAVRDVVVRATIVGSSPGRTSASPPVVVAATRSRRLASLDPGRARYVTLASAKVHLGGAYVVTVTVTATGVAPVVDRVHVRVASA